MNTEKTHRILAVVALALTPALALAGCAANDAAHSPGHGPGSSSPAATPSSSPDASAHNRADVAFAQAMIPHHAQAVTMSETLLAKDGVSEEVRRLADEISAAQGPEIEQLSALLEEWGEDPDAHIGHPMDGMMSDQDMAALESATGAEAERLFLEQMIRHHTGAVDMARAEAADGENPAAIAMANEIVSAQEAEIDLMNDLLASR